MIRASQFRSFKFGSRQPIVGREQECLAAIATKIAESGGISPTFEELCKTLAIPSKSSVSRLINRLVTQGKLRRIPNRKCALEIIPWPAHDLSTVYPKPTLDLGRHSVFVVTRVDGEATLMER